MPSSTSPQPSPWRGGRHGPIHQLKERKQKDQNRTAELDRFGIRVLRFTNGEIKSNISKVMKRIREEIRRRKLYKKNN